MNRRKRCCIGNVNIKMTAHWEKGIKWCYGLVISCCFERLYVSLGCYWLSICKKYEVYPAVEGMCLNFYSGSSAISMNPCVPQTFFLPAPRVIPQLVLGHQGQLGPHPWILCFPKFLSVLCFILIKGRVTTWNRALGLSRSASCLYRRESLLSPFITWTTACSS